MGFVGKLQQLRDDLLDATITQGFGPTDVSLEPRWMGFPHFHKGIDYVLRGGRGANVRSAASGIIEHAGWYNGYGNAIIVSAPNGYTYLYGHMDSLRNASTGQLRQVGEAIEAGDVIGQMGSTGASTGPHVHLQVMDSSGTPVDPTGARDPQGRLRVDAWQNTDVRKLFGELYHVLGFGGGYLGNAQIDNPPSPTQRSFAPEPTPLPTAASDYGDPTNYPPSGTQDPPGSGGTPPAGTGQPVDWLPTPGGLLTGGLQGVISQGPALERQIGPAIFVGVLAFLLLLVGILALVRKPAVEAVKAAAVAG